MPQPNSTTRIIRAIGLALAQRSRNQAPAAHEVHGPRHARASTSPLASTGRRAPTVDGLR